MLKISVVTPSVRKEGLEVVKKSLERQSFPRKYWEWIVVSPFKYQEADKWIKDPPKKKGEFWSLNKAYNLAIKAAKGPLIISWQDWIWGSDNTFSRFWFWFKEKGDKWATTGSGHQYQRLDDFGKPIIQVWEDPRKGGIVTYGEAYECFPVDWELNFCSAPKKAFYDIGGFDERLDKMAGMDNVSVCERMDALGYRFWIDHGLDCRGLKHNRLPNWDKQHAMHGFYEQRKKFLIDKSLWPKLNFL